MFWLWLWLDASNMVLVFRVFRMFRREKSGIKAFASNACVYPNYNEGPNQISRARNMIPQKKKSHAYGVNTWKIVYYEKQTVRV